MQEFNQVSRGGVCDKADYQRGDDVDWKSLLAYPIY